MIGRSGTIEPVSVPLAPVPVAASRAGGNALPGFLLSGFLLALLGAILPAWGYHRDPADFTSIGNYFLSLAVGIVYSDALRAAASRTARPDVPARLRVLSFVPGAGVPGFRVASGVRSGGASAGLLSLGAGAGLLNMALFYAYRGTTRSTRREPSTKGGIWYGLGCLTATLLVAGTFYAYSVPTILLFMAAAPAVFAGDLFAVDVYRADPERAPDHSRGVGRLSQPGRDPVRAAPVFPVRERMVDRRLAAPVPDPAHRTQPESAPAHPGALLVFPDGGTARFRGDPAARSTRPAAPRQRALRIVRLPHSLLHEQPLRRGHRRRFPRSRVLPASIRWSPRRSAAAFRITIPASSTASSPWPWSADCWPLPLWAMPRARSGSAS